MGENTYIAILNSESAEEKIKYQMLLFKRIKSRERVWKTQILDPDDFDQIMDAKSKAELIS